MPTKTYTFSGLIADSTGTVSGTTTDSQPLNLYLQSVTVRSKTGCHGRIHSVTASISGGATFNFNGQMTDCTDLVIQLGGILLPFLTPATIVFQVQGYNLGESVDLEGMLTASVFAAQPVLSGANGMAAPPLAPPSIQPTSWIAMPKMISSMIDRLPIVGKGGMIDLFRQGVQSLDDLVKEIRRSNDSRNK